MDHAEFYSNNIDVKLIMANNQNYIEHDENRTKNLGGNSTTINYIVFSQNCPLLFNLPPSKIWYVELLHQMKWRMYMCTLGTSYEYILQHRALKYSYIGNL